MPTVWIPQYKIAFPGDNFYPSFPNLLHARGTSPRYALDYVDSLDRVLSWNPEILAPSHGDPIFGREAVRDRVQKYRDAISTCTTRPSAASTRGRTCSRSCARCACRPRSQTVDTGEVYGRVDWSVRGIFDGYVGWFDGNVSEHVRDAARRRSIRSRRDGRRTRPRRGPRRRAARRRRPLQGVAHERRRAPGRRRPHRHALEVRRDALQGLLANAVNLNERGWLTAGLREVEQRPRTRREGEFSDAQASPDEPFAGDVLGWRPQARLASSPGGSDGGLGAAVAIIRRPKS